jgi:ferredoxin
MDTSQEAEDKAVLSAAMKKYEVRIDRDKCVGYGFCEKVSPNFWFIEEGKARIKNENNGMLVIDESSLKSNISAAKVCPALAIDVIDLETGKSVTGIEKDKIGIKKIVACYDSRKEWAMDPKGFFTIKPFPKEGMIKVRYYNARHQLACEIEGKNAEEIYNTLVREGLVSMLAHAAYLGSELQKAEIAMKENAGYVQDEPLKLQ